MVTDFDRVIHRRGTNCEKFDGAKAHGYPEDILPLWVADMDFQAPPCVTEALRKAVDHGIFGYSFLSDGYYDAVTGWFRKQFHWYTEKEWIVTTPGVVYGVAAAVRALTEPGDAVMIQTPVYYPFYAIVERNGRRLVENPLLFDGTRYTMDLADMERKIRECGVKLMILCSPHNPVCRVWTREELQGLGKLCLQYGVTVISDEIHCDFAFPEHPHIPLPVACPQLAEQTVVCTAPSKSFNLAGLQVSNLFIPGKLLRERVKRELQYCFWDAPNVLGAVACEAAYRGGEQWLTECKAYMRENLRYVREFLGEHLPQIRLIEPEGTYFAWLDCTGLGLTKEELDNLIIEKAGLWLDTGSIFGGSAALFQRVVLACPRQTVVQAMEKLEKAVNNK